MVQSLKVILWGEEIGRLAWDTRHRLSCFMYNPAFLKKGLNISPLAAPVDGARGLTPVWGEEAKIYQKNPDEFYIPSDVAVVGVEMVRTSVVYGVRNISLEIIKFCLFPDISSRQI